MIPSAYDYWRTRLYVARYNAGAAWHRLGWANQILIAAVLWAMFVLVAFPRLGDLIEQAVWGEVL